MKGKGRQANIELLRIIAMLMVVTLHYLIKGQAAVSLTLDMGVLNLLLWFVKAMCIVTINVYVLISGYFLPEGQWKISRLFTLWLQVMFYSLGVPLVCFLADVGEVRVWGLYDWINVLFPVQMEHYWFITAYVVLYLLVPVLSTGVKKLTKKQHGLVVVGLLLVFSVPKSILPVGIPTDRFGYDYGWFICLFMVASFIRNYGISFLNNKKKAFTLYIISVFGIWGISLMYGFLSRKGLSFRHAMDMSYSYNHILVLIASVALFCGFQHIRIPQGKIANGICKISSYSLGVYLLHENIAIRSSWQSWAGIDRVRDGWEIFPHMIVTVFAIFIAGVLVDFVRECIFRAVQRAWIKFFAGRNAKTP